MKTLTLRNGASFEVPEIEITARNAYGLLIASRRKLGELLSVNEAKRSETHDLCIDFTNSVIFKCVNVLDLDVSHAARASVPKISPSEFHRNSRR